MKHGDIMIIFKGMPLIAIEEQDKTLKLNKICEKCYCYNKPEISCIGLPKSCEDRFYFIEQQPIFI